MSTSPSFDAIQKSLYEAIVQLDVLRIAELKKPATNAGIMNINTIDTAKRQIARAQAMLNGLDQAQLLMS